MDSSRVLVAVILSLVLIFAYQELVLKHLYPPTNNPQTAGAKSKESALSGASVVPSPGATVEAPAGEQSAPSASASAAAAAASHPVPAEMLSPPPGASAAARTIKIDTPQYAAVLNTVGARIESLKLKDYSQSSKLGSGWYQMVAKDQPRNPLGVTIDRAGVLANDSNLDYSCSGPSTVDLDNAGQAKIACTAKTADGLTLTKTVTFRGGSYAFGFDATVEGPGKIDAIGLALSQPMAELPGGYRDYPMLQALVGGKSVSDYESNLKKGFKPEAGKIQYAGFGDRYFLTAYLPRNPDNGELTADVEGNDSGLTRMMFSGAQSMNLQVYMGPKLLDALEAVDPSLNKAIDFGWWGIVSLPFLRVLKLFHLFAPNWGWDIILLTVALRILMLPMSIKSQRSMMKMQRLSPQMQRIREKFKDDNERQQKEMVELYKRNHVNPLGGCLPMAIQFPIFIGLYEALLNAVELRHSPFALWIHDLSAPDCLPISWMPKIPYLDCHGLPVLVLLMGASTFLQQWMSPTSPDPNQQKMMMLTPIIFTVLFVNFPAGLSLYYFASNVLGVIQQVFLNREFRAYSPA